MKLSVMSYTLARGKKPEEFDVVRMCQLTRELNLDGVDIVTTYGRKPSEIRKTLDDFGLKAVCHTFMADLSATDSAGRTKGVDVIKQGVETAVALRTDKVMIPTPGRDGVPRDELRHQIIGALQEAIPFARNAGITLTVENFPGAGSPFVVASDVLEAVRAVPGLKITFDNGNVFTGGEAPAACYTQCAEHIVHSHFKDWELTKPNEGMKGLDGRWYRGALIGEAIVDHKSCLAAMAKADYSGYINIEYEGNKYNPEEATRRGARYLQGLIDAL